LEKGKVNWCVGEDVASHGSCVEERQKAASVVTDGWWGEQRNKGNRDETFEVSLQSWTVTQKMERSQSG